MKPATDKPLDYYTVTVERDTGLWIGLRLATGKTVDRDEWLRLMEDDPEHFQLLTLTTEELTNYSMALEDVLERAVFVMWSDEQRQYLSHLPVHTIARPC